MYQAIVGVERLATFTPFFACGPSPVSRADPCQNPALGSESQPGLVLKFTVGLGENY
jgi:hypothetical protein